jgi:NADH dehydrogenase (ubiquinone) 1 beta subcomplex subunit 9
MSVSTFSAAHRAYVKSLYKRFLVNSLNWTIRRDLWRPRALDIRARFEQNRWVDAAGWGALELG